jgi:hypothetical protein
MSLIVDANCAATTLCTKPCAAFAPVMTAIRNGDATLVFGGTKLKREYLRLSSVWRFVVALDRAGKAKAISDREVDTLQASLEKSGSLRSDDPHIIALAKVSGARLLCSLDHDLHFDFLSKQLIDKPRGSVYQNSSHALLLKKYCGK